MKTTRQDGQSSGYKAKWEKIECKLYSSYDEKTYRHLSTRGGAEAGSKQKSGVSFAAVAGFVGHFSPLSGFRLEFPNLDVTDVLDQTVLAVGAVLGMV